jgi:hypothetical protein
MLYRRTPNAGLTGEQPVAQHDARDAPPAQS